MIFIGGKEHALLDRAAGDKDLVIVMAVELSDARLEDKVRDPALDDEHSPGFRRVQGKKRINPMHTQSQQER